MLGIPSSVGIALSSLFSFLGPAQSNMVGSVMAEILALELTEEHPLRH
jgi:hypothetical protein